MEMRFNLELLKQVYEIDFISLYNNDILLLRLSEIFYCPSCGEGIFSNGEHHEHNR